MKPYRIRFMTEIGCDFALWGDPFRPLPVNGEYDVDDLEHVLPLPDSLRAAILSWAALFERYDGGERGLDMAGFDERGMHLSRDLQRELGSEYAVRYLFTFAGSRERLLPTVADVPCPGWGAK